jgi:hypothetical protein
MTNGLLIYGENLRIASYIRNPFLIYDFEHDPIHNNIGTFALKKIIYVLIRSPIFLQSKIVW